MEIRRQFDETQLVMINSICVLHLNLYFVCIHRSSLFNTGYPPKLYFQIPCVFPVPIYIIHNYNMHKTDLVDLSSFWEKMEIFNVNTAIISFTFRIQRIYNLSKQNSLFFGKISKFPVFSLTENFLGPFSLFSLCSGYPVNSAYYEYYQSIPLCFILLNRKLPVFCGPTVWSHCHAEITTDILDSQHRLTMNCLFDPNLVLVTKPPFSTQTFQLFV